MLQENEFINAWEIIKGTNKSEPWTNFDTYEEYITQTEKQSTVQILKAKEYFAKELIRIIIKNWKYDYLREQFEETEENITDLMIKEHDNHELLDLKTRIRLTKNELQPLTKEEIEKLTNEKTYQNPLNLKNTFYTKEQPLEDKLFQINPIASRIFGRKNIQWKDTSISEQSEKYKELREKVNNIFDKPSKEGILKILKQDPYT
ncbi:38041_t:CDS:2, partial [Gigaspora margarita]